jgi:hypothetical protein
MQLLGNKPAGTVDTVYDLYPTLDDQEAMGGNANTNRSACEVQRRAVRSIASIAFPPIDSVPSFPFTENCGTMEPRNLRVISGAPCKAYPSF